MSEEFSDDTIVRQGPRALRVLRPLGEGGMGEVTVGARREGRFERTYAIKRLRPELRALPEARRAFLEEARLSALLYHPNVVRVHDAGEDDEGPFLVMDLVEGVSVLELVREAARRDWEVPLEVALEIGRDIALGLRAAHEARDAEGAPTPILHRDVSPQNVLLGYDGIARLADFGIARVLGSTSAHTRAILQGKRGYMAPEILRFEPPVPASDVFSAGVVLHELLAGEALYRGPDLERRILDEPPPDLLEARPDAPDGLVELTLTLLAKDPARRPAARLLVDRLEALLAEAALDALDEDPWTARRFVRALFRVSVQ